MSKKSSPRIIILKIRCTEQFKKALKAESKALKKERLTYFSQSDILHLALAEYLNKYSLYIEDLAPEQRSQQKQLFKNKLMFN